LRFDVLYQLLPDIGRIGKDHVRPAKLHLGDLEGLLRLQVGYKTGLVLEGGLELVTRAEALRKVGWPDDGIVLADLTGKGLEVIDLLFDLGGRGLLLLE